IVTRRLEFDTAHRLMNHESKCRFVHGHRYVLEASFGAEELDEIGRVVDFSVIKDKLGNWLDEHWDHNLELCEKDKALGEALAEHVPQNIYYIDSNPTAENMLRYLKEKIIPALFDGTGITLVKLKLHETPNCSAEIELV